MTDAYSTQHPHEPATPPVIDDEGRCLVCGIEWRVQQMAQIISVLRARVAAAEAICDYYDDPGCEDDAVLGLYHAWRKTRGEVAE